jgi:hypothetical protein
MSDILIGVIVFGLVFGAAIFGMFLGRNLRALEQKVNASDKLSETQGRPVPNRRSRQTDRLNELERTTYLVRRTRCYT